MTRPTAKAPPDEVVTVECAASYHAEKGQGFAFVFAIRSTGTRFTLHSYHQDQYDIGETYRMVLAPAEVVPLLWSVQDAEFLRHCLGTVADRWRDGITEAETGAARPASPRPATAGHLNVEPTPAGYAAAHRLLTAQLNHLTHLAALLDQHLAHAHAQTTDTDTDTEGVEP